MKRNKKIKIIAIAAVLVMAIGIILGVYLFEQEKISENELSDNKSALETQSEENAEAETEKQDTQEGDEAKNAQESAESSGNDDTDTSQEENNNETTSENQSDEGTGSESSPKSESNVPETEEESTNTEMALPYTVPGTGLVIDHINSYSGVFIEDGSDENVENIFAAHITNTSEQNVEYSRITASINGNSLVFELSDLPAGAGVSVLESSRAAYVEGNLTYIDNQTAYADSFSMLDNEVGMVVGDDNGITVTNLTQEDIPCIRIFYKFASDENEYLGGITYTAKIDDLKASASMTIYPSHFAKEGSKIMMVRRYDSTE